MATIDKDSLGLVTNLGYGAGILISVCILFDVLRYFFPKIYFYREIASKLPENNDYDGKPMYAPPRPSNWPFAWIKPVLWYPEETFIRTHGLDAALFIRFLKINCFMFGFLSIWALVVLLPVYATAGNKDVRLRTGARVVEGVQILSLSNVKDKDWRLWITLVSELLVVTVITFFIRKEMHNHKTYRLAYRADSSRNPSNYAIMVLDVPQESRTEELIRKFFVRCLPGEVREVYHLRDAENLVNAKSKIIAAMKAREKDQFRLIKAAHAHPDKDHAKLEDAVIESLAKQKDAEIAHKEMLANIDEHCPLTHAAIVMFYSKRAATVAASTPLWNNASEWKIERAPEPKAVNWNRIEITSYTSLIRSLITMFLVTLFAVFWFGPVACIQALGKLNKLAKDFPGVTFLGDLVESTNTDAKNFVAFVENILPVLLLFIILQLVPMLFRFIIGFERIAGCGAFEGKIRSHLFVFYVMSNFFYVVITGSVLQQLKAMLNDPRKIVSILSKTVPAQATFLMKYVLINSFLGSAMGLLNAGRLLIRPFLMMGARTTRAKKGADAIFSEYPLFKMYALTQMIALISIVYSTIAPLICVVATIYFGIAYATTKFVIMYSHRPFFESGGHMYPGAWYSILFGLYLHQFVLIGIFSLKLAAAQATIAILTMFLTLGFSVYCFKSFFRIARHGSLMDQLDADDRAGFTDRIPEEFIQFYVHPGLQPMTDTEDLTGLPREMRSAKRDLESQNDDRSIPSGKTRSNGTESMVTRSSQLTFRTPTGWRKGVQKHIEEQRRLKQNLQNSSQRTESNPIPERSGAVEYSPDGSFGTSGDVSSHGRI